MLVAFDPGRNIGMAFVSNEGELLTANVVELADLQILDIPEAYHPHR